jgi:hypothetical protein
MLKLYTVLTATCSLLCSMVISSSCSRDTLDEFGDDWIARDMDKAISELPDQHIPRDLCGEWERAEDVSECQIKTKALMINSDGKLSGIEYIEGEDGTNEYSVLNGLCNFNSKTFEWVYRSHKNNVVSRLESKIIIYWDSEALIIGEDGSGFCSIFSRDGDPIDSEILSNRDSRLFGMWGVIGNKSSIVFNPDGTGSFNGESFRNWFTIGDYVIKQYTHMDDYFVDAYRFSGDILQLGGISNPNWNDDLSNYARL